MQSNPQILKKPGNEPAKYELTLSEFPVFLLSKQSPQAMLGKGKPVPIEYQDTISDKNGGMVTRQWKIWPDGRHGHGTASTFSTMFELFQIWREQAFATQFINFGSIYNILKRKGVSPTKQAYGLIKRDLDCLIGIRIEARNAFWDNEHRKYATIIGGFHLFDNYFTFDNPPEGPGQVSLPLGTIKANDVLYKSVCKNSLLITDFDRAFFHKLTPVEQRLALYLSKIFKSQTIHRRKMLELAKQIPIYTQQTRNVKQKIKKACQGLIKKGFSLLGGFTFQKTTDGQAEMVVFCRRSRNQVNGAQPEEQISNHEHVRSTCQVEHRDQLEKDLFVQDIMAICGDEKSANFYKKVARLMPRELIYQALAEVKEVRNLGTIKKSTGALFTKLIKDKANNLGLAL